MFATLVFLLVLCLHFYFSKEGASLTSGSTTSPAIVDSRASSSAANSSSNAKARVVTLHSYVNATGTGSDTTTVALLSVNKTITAPSNSNRKQLGFRMKKLPCLHFGKTYGLSLKTTNVNLDCTLPNNRDIKICCAAVSNDTIEESRGVGLEFQQEPSDVKTGPSDGVAASCVVSSIYISSPQEQRELSKAKAMYTSSEWNETNTRIEFIEYTSSQESIANATRWLARVKVHMQTGEIPVATVDDWEFLSRFHVTKTCGSTVVQEWIEWIEPITMHARHPFAMSQCRTYMSHVRALNRTFPSTAVCDTDHVLLQSGQALANRAVTRQPPQRPLKRFLFDAGSSSFESSLFFFTCGYSQRRISFDAVYAWEMTLLDPKSYWRTVPAKWKPYIHFSNVPISSVNQHADSPLTFINELGEHDFVAFKLDIDHSTTEIPMALKLLESASAYVDEFFFEFHFHCEIMHDCGWGSVPLQNLGITLDRLSVMNFFVDLRKKGIRSHIWP